MQRQRAETETMSKSITMLEVAREAGVSSKTVSRVLNNEPVVRHETRKRVVRAIDELGYSPHPGARIMRGRRSGIIGMITSAISSAGEPASEAGLSSIHIVRGVQQVCAERQLTLMIADSGESDEEFRQLTSVFENHRVEGVVFATGHHRQVSFPIPTATPSILVNCFDESGTAAVVPNDRQGQKLATQYLLELGHKKIGMVGLHEEAIAESLRRAGYFEACREAGNEPGQGFYRIGVDSSDAEDLFAALSVELLAMLDSPVRPTAIMFGNDLMALRARPVIEKAGIRIPQDLSVVGFDDDARICEVLSPPLTTVLLPYFEMGRRAAEILLNANERGIRADGIERVPCSLVKRRSAAAPST